MNEDEDFNNIIDIRYNEIFLLFKNLFQEKGYNINGKFDNKVWFLKNDDAFNLVAYNTPQYDTPTQNSKMIQILNELNQNSNLKDLTVVTNEFIGKISKTINNANLAIEISNKSIKQRDIHHKLAIIDETLKLLGIKIENKQKGEFKSKLNTSIISMKNFPSGPFRPSLIINTAFDEENLNELNESEKRNLDRNLDKNVFNLFKEQIINTRDTITIPNNKNSIKFDSNESNSLITEQNNVFDEYIFEILNIENNNYLVDKRYSGSTFSNFKIKVKGSEDLYESRNQYLLHILLTSIEELCELSNDIISKELTIKLKAKNEIQEVREVLLKMEFELDPLTRSGILNRIKKLISIPIEDNTKNKYMIEQILTDYFPTIKKSCIDILHKTEEEKKDCCSIF